MIKFEKVTYDQYKKDTLGDDFQYSMFADENEQEYKDIVMPRRSTKFSAGYDFFAPRDISIRAGEAGVIYTGIRAVMPGSLFLALYPRSGLGIKHRTTLANCVGIIDADYRNAANEGHIIFKLVNDSDHTVSIRKGSAFAQGIFQMYLLTDDDAAAGERKGGLGSTDKE